MSLKINLFEFYNAICVYARRNDMAKELQVLEPWSYEKSVETSRVLVKAFRKVSLDLVRELHAAREALSNQGFRVDLKAKNRIPGASNADLLSFESKLHSFKGYLKDIGLSEATAFRWLALYIPDEDRLLTPEEMKQRLEARYGELKALIASHIGDPSWRPDGWTQPFENRYQRELRERRLDVIAQASSFDEYMDEGGQFWLFDQPYLETLSERIGSYNADIVAYRKLCKAYAKDARRDVDIRKQVSIFQLTKAALEDISDEARPEVARFVAELILKDAAGTLTY